MTNHKAGPSSQERIQQAFQAMQAKVAAYERERSEPIAIIGVGCRFPGGADSPEEFWDLLHDGRDAITRVPPERWDCEALYDPNPQAEGKICTRMGAFISGAVDCFDAQLFGITPREAASLDPQQRLLLEVAWEALERAGLPANRQQGNSMGIYIGSFNNDYLRLQITDHSPFDAYGLLGTMDSALAGRLAYLLGTQGPTLQVDTACSSSLVAIHLACQSLRQGECSVALAGAVSLMLTPEPSMYLSRMGVLAPDGYCKTFDARADGFIRGEGCGVVVLKRLSAAQADGDTILALIRGSAVNHDGQSNGFTAPNGLAQQELLRSALQNARVQPAQIHYVEAHGTGTALGDPIELQALAAVMGAGHEEHPLLVSSVKTNIGHLEPVAGMAGLFKVILALQHEEIPSHLHLNTPSPYIPWSALPLHVPTCNTPWPRGAQPRIAGVSSFGLTGTNAHVIVEEAPLAPSVLSSVDTLCLLPLSAHTPNALHSLLQSYQRFLSANTSDTALHDLCNSASTRRSHYPYRAYAIGYTYAEIQAQLEAFLDDEQRIQQASVAGAAEKLVFVFPGQGSQWNGMGKRLFAHEPVFRAAIEQCAQAMQPYLACSLIDLLHQDHEWEHIDSIQPLLFAIQVALVHLWRSWGVTPAAVVGHSMGEIAAFHIAGALSLDDACQIICQRSHLLRRISGQGAMALIDLSPEETRHMLMGYESRLSIAVSNSSRSTVIAGDVAAIEEVIDWLTTLEIFCRRIKVDVASHSPQVDVLCDDLANMLAPICPQNANIVMYSTVTASSLQGSEAIAAYWVRNLRQTVLFASTIDLLGKQGYTLFLEISPHPILLSAIEEEFRHRQQPCRTISSLRRDEEELRVLVESLGALYSAGYPIDWRRYYPAQGRRNIPLPTLPWQREHYWLEKGHSPSMPAPQFLVNGTAAYHPFPGTHFSPALHPETHYWEHALSISTLPSLVDHRVQDAIVLPAAAYLEMALSSQRELTGSTTCSLTRVRFEQMLHLDAVHACRIQMVLSMDQGSEATFRILSCVHDEPGVDSHPHWMQHVQGTIQRGPVPEQLPLAIHLDEVLERCPRALSDREFYAKTREQGLHYGPGFQGIEQVWQGEDEAIARLRIPPALQAELQAPYTMHPALLDACLQTMLACISTDVRQEPYVPIAVELVYAPDPSLLASSSREPGLWSYARLHTSNDMAESRSLTGNIILTDKQGQVLLALSGLKLLALPSRFSSGQHDALKNLFYTIDWQPYTPPPPTRNVGSGTWLILQGREQVGQHLKERLEAQGTPCVTVLPGPNFAPLRHQTYQASPTRPDDWVRLLEAVLQPPQNTLLGVIHLWGLDSTNVEELENLEGHSPNTLTNEQNALCGSVLHLVQALSALEWRDPPRLWLVTSGAQRVLAQEPVSPIQTMLWGMGRSIAYEQPRMQCTLVDLSQHPSHDEQEQLSTAIRSAYPEDQIALRRAHCYVARLMQHQPERTILAEPLIDADGLPFALEMEQPGTLDDLHVRALTPQRPAANEVEIAVEATALNFLDVLHALGIYPGQQAGSPILGRECCGRITALGEHVTGLHLGEEVIALVPNCFRSFVNVPASFVFAKPSGLSAEEAAALPLVFLTAYYALIHLAHLGRGEHLLIHSASGGTGLAALRIAQLVGAEIIATAGTDEKRDYLRSLGIEHVFDSRSLAFAEQIRAVTGGVGVDVVLNSLTGEAASESLALLRPFGRFLEISKKDIYQDGQLALSPFRKNLSYMTIDIAALLRERPGLARSLLQEVFQLFSRQQLQPLPVQRFSIAEAREAFQTMAQAKHIGKVVVSLQQRAHLQIKPERQALDHEAGITIRADGSYLLTGGLGGLGLHLATWLVQQQAGHVILVGRRPPSPAAQATLDHLQQQGASLEVVLADISQVDELAALLTRVKQQKPPLHGLIHLAAHLHDGILPHLTLNNFQQVMAPKVAGAWHLHMLTRDIPLDFFVLFSSVASLIGSQAQSNYAAANAFLDGLANYRQQQGLPGLSINWGAWARIGLAAAEEKRGQRLELQGLISMSPEQGIGAFQHLLRQPIAGGQIGVMDFNLKQWRQSTAYAMRSPLFAALTTTQLQTAVSSSPLRVSLQNANAGERHHLLQEHIREHVTRVLRLPATRIDTDATFKSLGFDSLMAVELRNLLEQTTGLTLPSTLIWRYSTITLLAEHLAEKMDLPLLSPVVSDAGQTTPEETMPDEELLHYSSEEVAELLSKELDELTSKFFTREWE
jgi:myxalamid-type polyketide synthase MxaB